MENPYPGQYTPLHPETDQWWTPETRPWWTPQTQPWWTPSTTEPVKTATVMATKTVTASTPSLTTRSLTGSTSTVSSTSSVPLTSTTSSFSSSASASSTSSSSASTLSASTHSSTIAPTHHSNLSHGDTTGIIIGSVLGTLLVATIAGFSIWRHHRRMPYNYSLAADGNVEEEGDPSNQEKFADGRRGAGAGEGGPRSGGIGVVAREFPLEETATAAAATAATSTAEAVPFTIPSVSQQPEPLSRRISRFVFLKPPFAMRPRAKPLGLNPPTITSPSVSGSIRSQQSMSSFNHARPSAAIDTSAAGMGAPIMTRSNPSNRSNQSSRSTRASIGHSSHSRQDSHTSISDPNNSTIIPAIPEDATSSVMYADYPPVRPTPALSVIIPRKNSNGLRRGGSVGIKRTGSLMGNSSSGSGVSARSGASARTGISSLDTSQWVSPSADPSTVSTLTAGVGIGFGPGRPTGNASPIGLMDVGKKSDRNGNGNGTDLSQGQAQVRRGQYGDQSTPQAQPQTQNVSLTQYQPDDNDLETTSGSGYEVPSRHPSTPQLPPLPPVRSMLTGLLEDQDG